MTKLKKTKKKKQPILKPFWVLFCPNLGQKWIFLEKMSLPVFQYSNYLPLCQKLEKPNGLFLRKLLGGHTKNQFISLISLWDTASFEIDWKILQSWLAKSILGHISQNGIVPNMKFVQAYSNYSNINFHYRPNW